MALFPLPLLGALHVLFGSVNRVIAHIVARHSGLVHDQRFRLTRSRQLVATQLLDAAPGRVRLRCCSIIEAVEDDTHLAELANTDFHYVVDNDPFGDCFAVVESGLLQCCNTQCCRCPRRTHLHRASSRASIVYPRTHALRCA